MELITEQFSFQALEILLDETLGKRRTHTEYIMSLKDSLGGFYQSADYAMAQFTRRLMGPGRKPVASEAASHETDEGKTC